MACIHADQVTPNFEVENCASLQIDQGSVLDIGYNPGSNFGVVSSNTSGNGNFRLTTSFTTGTVYVFPAGDFSDFNVNKGTTEYYTINPNSGTIFILPPGVTSYGNLILSPLLGSNLIMPNNSYTTINGNLINRGQNVRSWNTMSWPDVPRYGIVVAKTVYIKGNLDIQSGSFGWYQNGNVAQNVIVDGDVIIDPHAGIDDWDAGDINQNVSIGGSLINNSTGEALTAMSHSWCRLQQANVIFIGNNSALITSTVGTTMITSFNKVTVNKGNSQATTLTCNIGER